MLSHSILEKNNYIISRRTYAEDYSNIDSKDIDMTLSGTFLNKYPEFDIDYKCFDSYPEKRATKELIEIIKKKNSIKKEVLLGAGSNGILQNLIRTYIRSKKDNLVTPFYTFNQAEYATTSCGGYTKRVLLDEYDVNLERMKKSIDKNTKLVYMCNPNNPTGRYIDGSEIIKFCKSINIPVIVDESAIEFSHKKSLINMNMPKNLVVLRSFSKAYGLANLRLGYMVCDKAIKNDYVEHTTTNEFSGFSVYITTKMINNEKCIKKNVELIEKERDTLEKELNKLGIKTIKSCTNTIMTETEFDKEFLKELSKNNVSIVPIHKTNDKYQIRIAVQDKETNRKFIKVIKNIINK